MSESDIDKFLFKARQLTPMTGAAIVVGNSRGLVFEKYFGTIHPSQTHEVNESTRFDIQSISKVVSTASLLAHFAEQNSQTLEEYAYNFLPELSAEPYRKIKIKHLLQHQSGYSDEDFTFPFCEPKDGWQKMLALPLRFEPGSAVEYSDIGYRILGRVLEVIGQKDLDTLCKNHVWRVIEMQDTGYDVSAVHKTHLAGQGQSWGRVDDEQDYKLGGHLGCDGVFTTACDLAKFCQSILNKKNNSLFLKLNPVGELYNEKSFFDSLVFGQKYCGWEKNAPINSYAGQLATPETLEKAGGAGAFISILPEKSSYAIYLTNHGRPDPFTAESWNHLIRDLKVQNIFETLLQ